MTRPTDCPRCGKRATGHTGSYCQECGEPLVSEGKKKAPARHYMLRVMLADRRGALETMKLLTTDEQEALAAARLLARQRRTIVDLLMSAIIAGPDAAHVPFARVYPDGKVE